MVRCHPERRGPLLPPHPGPTALHRAQANRAHWPAMAARTAAVPQTEVPAFHFLPPALALPTARALVLAPGAASPDRPRYRQGPTEPAASVRQDGRAPLRTLPE